MSVAGDVVRSHDVASRDAQIWGHRRCLDEVLWAIEGVHAVGTAYAPVGSITIQVAEVHWTPVQTGLRPTVESFFISMENAICVEQR